MSKPRYGPRCVIAAKHSFGSYNLALRIKWKQKLDGNPYRCDICGWYHVTGMTRQEAARHRAKKNWEKWNEKQERGRRGFPGTR